MAHMTRKSFLQKTSAGAAVAGAMAAVPGAALAARPAPSTHVGASEPFVVYVRNPAAGELALLVGDQEFKHVDRDLVSRLWNIRSAGRAAAKGRGR